MEPQGKPESQRKAFENIVRQYSEQLYWKIRRIVLDHEDANDVLQNTFLKAWKNLPEFKGDSKKQNLVLLVAGISVVTLQVAKYIFYLSKQIILLIV